jgi:uncharacterized membrane protein
MAGFGLGVVALVYAVTGRWSTALIIGWAVACITYIAWVLLTVLPMDAQVTAEHATSEDPARAVADLMVLAASLVSLAAIVVLLAEADAAAGMPRMLVGSLTVASVALSWVLIHTLFTLRYASLYYSGVDGGVSFNQSDPPRYSDFAYLAFTLGMTFQVSDTNITSHDIRMTALRHSLLSYLFASVVLATVINLVVGLSRV